MPAIRALALALLPLAAAPVQDVAIPDHPSELRLPPPRPFTPPHPDRRVLERGARLLVIENRELPLVDGALVFRGGSLLVDPDRAGLVELCAEVLREGGSERTSGAELDDWLDGHGASITVSGDLDSFRIAFSCLEKDLDRVLEAIGELLVIPAYPEDEIEKGKRRLATRIELRRENPRELADQALLEAIHGADCPLARRPIERTVEALTREDLQRYHRANLGIDRLVAGVVGAVDPDTFARQLEVLLARLPVAGPGPEPPGVIFRQPTRTRIHLYDRPGTPQSEIRLAGPGTRRLHRDFTALNLWSQAIGTGGLSNRLMVRLRTELGLIYGGGVSFRPGWERAGTLYGFCRTGNDTVGETVDAMLDVLRGGLEELPAGELEKVRRQLLSAEVFQVDRPEKVLARALELELHDAPPDLWERHSTRLRELTAAEVREAVQRHLDVDRLVWVVVGPAEELEEQLARRGEVARIGPGPPGEAQVGLLLQSLGGCEAWRELRYLESEVTLIAAGGRPMKLHVWQDLHGPRMRVEQELGGGSSVLVVNEKGAWMRTGDSVLEMPAERHEELVAVAWRDVHRLLALLARSETCLLERGESLRFTVIEGPAKGTWLELDETGHPSRLGYAQGDEDVVLEFSGWRDLEGVFAPTEIEKRPEVWTRRIESVRSHATLDAELFERP